jgi:hypothetical protein
MTVWKLRKWFEPMTIALSVDRGQVHCPVRARDVDIEHCVDCRFRREVLPDGQHDVKEIICQPPFSAMRGAV